MKTVTRSRRAPAMAADERRAAIIDATICAIKEHGTMPTTRQIATTAKVAEGTIFRVFDTKEELREAVLEHTFDPGQFLQKLSLIDTDQPLRGLLIDIVEVLHQRLGATFSVMRALGLSAPPTHVVGPSADQIRSDTASHLRHLLDGHESELVLPADDFVHIVRLLSFAGSHHEIAHGRTLSPEQTVDILLYGALRRSEPCPAREHGPTNFDDPAMGV